MTRARRAGRGPLLLLAPGAGAPSDSAWMLAWAERLRAIGPVVAFDYPYMQAARAAGRERLGAPDRMPRLVAAHREALAAARAAHPGRPTLLCGKSMGSRMGCHLVTDASPPDPPVAGLVCFGYPLRGVGDPDGLKLRDQVLLDLRTPVLLLQGTRDPLCPLELLAPVRARMTARHVLHVVEGGDHDLALTRRQQAAAGTTQAASDAAVLAAIAAFAREVAG